MLRSCTIIMLALLSTSVCAQSKKESPRFKYELYDDEMAAHCEVDNLRVASNFEIRTGPMLARTVKWPFEFIPVHQTTFEKNEDIEHCNRPEEMVDTIVLHHSATSPSRSPQYINEMHLDEDYHMVGYSFIVNSSYEGEYNTNARITEGRPMNMVGSHAGGEAYVPMTKEQKQMWDDKKVTCGKKGQKFKVKPSYVKNGMILANVTTIGVVVIGNYAPAGLMNLNGYLSETARKPSKQTIDMISKLACQLQKKYPNIKTISWHSKMRETQCPGIIKNQVSQIIKRAKGMGCNFR